MTREATDIRRFVDELAFEEKLRLTHGAYPEWSGATRGGVGYLPPVDRLDLPPLCFEDGPLGVTSAGGTAFPAALALGASFDADLAAEFGEAVGAEARAGGVDVLLAPGCNLARVPRCGRNFEYYGEDPHHAARMTVATVRGIQSEGVVATPKHYVANNQEYERVRVSAEVDERALRELYLPAFERAVTEGDAGAVMAAYNRVNGTYATEHRELLTDVLKGEFGFEGPVVSDWWAVQDGPGAARAGLDLEMPGVGAVDWAAMLDDDMRPLRTLANYWPDGVPGPEAVAAWLLRLRGGPGGEVKRQPSSFARTLPAAIDRGRFPESRLDDMVARVLTLHERVGALDGERESVDVDTATHRALAERIATSGAVLLKNDDALPLDEGATVAVIGPHVDEAKTGGGGSSAVRPTATTSPLEGIRARSAGRVRAAKGHPPVEPSSPFDRELPSIGWLGSGDGTSIDAARSVAAGAEAAVVVVQDDATEGRDRASLSLPGRQDELIAAVADAADRTIVVLETAGPVEMPWIGAVDAAIEAWYPGQEAGRAIASLLYGDADPGGRLPMTFASEGAYPTSSTERYPGVESPSGYPEANYGEGVFAGYRHFDEYDVEPLFPFGHGLSYAGFEYAEVSCDGQSATVSLRNAADRPGREVVQCYLRALDPDVPRPPRELVGFEAVALDTGETRSVEIDLDERAFDYYDEDRGEWVTDSGEFVLEAGRSSRDVRGSAAVRPPER